MSAAERYDRLQELLVQRATEGCEQAEHREIAALLREFPDVQEDDWDLVAARGELELLSRIDDADAAREAPPATLPAALVRAAPQPTRRAAPRDLRAAAPWVVAAAAGVAALYFAVAPSPRPGDVEDAPRARAALLAAEGDVISLPWQGTDDPAAAGGVGGDVVWSDRAQRGFMRFRGLAPNDPRFAQYQLWIFDTKHPEATPVDGGVFDIPPGLAEVTVPIDAKLAVARPSLFAVTVEAPGGVVVSDRSRIAALASAPE